MDKVWIIAKREFAIHIRRWSFWVLTLGLPFLILLMGLAFFAVSFFATISSGSGGDRGGPPILGIVDPIPLFDWETLNQREPDQPPGAKPENPLLDELLISEELKRKLSSLNRSPRERETVYQVFPDEDEGREALVGRKIGGLLVFSDQFLETYEARLWVPDRKLGGRIPVRTLERHLRDHFLAERFPSGDLANILNPLRKLEWQYLQEEKADAQQAPQSLSDIFRRTVLPVIFMMVLVMVILFSTDRLLRGLVEEKQNRVIEILLSSVTAEQLMAGKVLGLGMLGFTQLAIWMGLGMLPLASVLPFFILGWDTLLLLGLLFLLGYFMLATLILGMGSVGNNIQEANQWALVFILVAILPLMFFPVFLENPEGFTAQTLSFFPLSSPFAVITRYVAHAIAPWEILLSLILLIAANWLAVKFSAKVFRVGILMTGKSPNPAELWRALKQS